MREHQAVLTVHWSVTSYGRETLETGQSRCQSGTGKTRVAAASFVEPDQKMD